MARPRPLLSDMPFLVLEKVSEKLDFDNRMRFRSCSKQMKTVVENTKCYWDSLTVHDDFDDFKLDLCDGVIDFVAGYQKESNDDDGVFCKNASKFLFDDTDVKDPCFFDGIKHVKKNPIDMLIADIRFMLVNGSRVFIKELDLDDDKGTLGIEFFTKLGALLSSMKHTISVQNLKMIGPLTDQIVMQVLPFLQPGALKTLHLTSSNREEFIWNQVQETEQWKRVTSLSVTVPILNIEVVKNFINEALERGETFEYMKIRSKICNRKKTRRYLRNNFDRLPGKQNLFYKKHPHMDCLLRFSLFLDSSCVLKNPIFKIIRICPVTYEPMD